MEPIKINFKNWSALRIIRLVLAGSLLIAYYYNREFIFLFAGIILTIQAAFNISCPGGSCYPNHKGDEKHKFEFKKYEPKKIDDMHSTFLVSKDQCLTCNNQVLKELGKLQGVFGAELERIDGRIVVSHTDEVSREEIAKVLATIGFSERADELTTEIKPDEPSIWGCAL